MKILKINILLIFIFCQGCFSFNFGTSKKENEIPPKMKEDLNDLNDSLPPKKNFEHKEAEKEVLYLAKENVKEADDLSSEFIVKDKLNQTNMLLESLTRSIGNPSQLVQNTIDNIKKMIKKLDVENKEFRRENEKYIANMEENSKLISRLQGLLEYKAEREKTLLEKIKFWFWVAIILSIVIVVFVPGGMIIVKRIWSKSFELFSHTARESAHAIGEMGSALSDYMATLDDKEREKFKNRLNKMKKGAAEYWDKVKAGENPLMLELHNAPKEIKKKVLSNGKK